MRAVFLNPRIRFYNLVWEYKLDIQTRGYVETSTPDARHYVTMPLFPNVGSSTLPAVADAGTGASATAINAQTKRAQRRGAAHEARTEGVYGAISS